MIALSCSHCGQQMNELTDDDGSKKARCGNCGRTVLLPASAKKRTRKRLGVLSGSVAEKPSLASLETRSSESKPVHEIPTRIEIPAPADIALTQFLSPPQASDEIGRLGPYRVLEVIGIGGMGVVMLAHDPQLDRRVALKAMLPALAANPTSRQRFLREARAAAGVQHDHIVTIFAVGEERGVPYLAMPYLPGESLEARLRRQKGPLPISEVLRIGREIAEGLTAIHALGLVHRDIKPGNVFLEGRAGRVKILDFGLARTVASDVQLTQDGAVVGSPAFMAPEQASRQPIDGRADLFGLGCVMYMMATGVLPFEGDDALSTLLAVTTVDPPAPRERTPEVPAPVSDLIMRLMAKKPDARFASAAEVVEAIAKLE